MGQWRNAAGTLATEAKQDAGNATLLSILGQLDDATADTVLTVLKAVLVKLDAVGVTGTVALDSSTLTALESINATVSGSVALDAGTLAALESITVQGGTIALDPATLAALESVTVGGTVALDSTTLSALENVTVTVSNPISGYATETTLASLLLALDGVETKLDSILTELQQKLEPGDISGLATAANQATAQTTLTSILAAVDQLEGYSDTLESLLTSLGTNTDGIETLLGDLKTYTDGIEGLLTTIRDNADTLEASFATLNAKDFATAANQATELTRLTEIRDYVDTVETRLASLLTELQLKADLTETQPVSAATLPLPTGAATESTVAKRFAGGKTTVALAISASGDNTVLTPASGQRLRIHWVGMSTSENNGAEVLAIVKFGANTHYRWNLGAPGAFSHWEPIEGAVDQSLVINLSGNQTVEVNVTYEEF
jgi:hypothetical protein